MMNSYLLTSDLCSNLCWPFLTPRPLPVHEVSSGTVLAGRVVWVEISIQWCLPRTVAFWYPSSTYSIYHTLPLYENLQRNNGSDKCTHTLLRRIFLVSFTNYLLVLYTIALLFLYVSLFLLLSLYGKFNFWYCKAIKKFKAGAAPYSFQVKDCLTFHYFYVCIKILFLKLFCQLNRLD